MSEEPAPRERMIPVYREGTKCLVGHFDSFILLDEAAGCVIDMRRTPFDPPDIRRFKIERDRKSIPRKIWVTKAAELYGCPSFRLA